MGEEWSLMAHQVPKSLDVNKLREWIHKLFANSKTLINQVARIEDSVVMSFKSQLLAELVLEAGLRSTEFWWRRVYTGDQTLAQLQPKQASNLVCIRGWNEENQFARSEVSDAMKKSGFNKMVKLAGSEVVLEISDPVLRRELSRRLVSVIPGLIVWSSRILLPNIISWGCRRGNRLKEPDIYTSVDLHQNQSQELPPSRKRDREEVDGAEDETRHHKLQQIVVNPQQKLLVRVFGQQELNTAALQKRFQGLIPGAGDKFCTVVATKERGTAIVELGSEAEANRVMDEYVKNPGLFSGLAIFRDKDYIRPRSLNKKLKASSPVDEKPQQVILEGFSPGLKQPELKGSLSELLERAFSRNRDINERGVLREFYIRGDLGFLTLSCNAAVEELVSKEKSPLVLSEKPLRFSLRNIDERTSALNRIFKDRASGFRG